MTQHEAIREALADGVELDLEAKAHLEECEECRAFAAALASADAELAALPPLSVSEELVARTMERIEREGAPERAPGVLALLAALMGALLGGLWSFARLSAAPFTRRRARGWTLGGLGLAVSAAAALLLVVGGGGVLRYAPPPSQGVLLDGERAANDDAAQARPAATDLPRQLAENERGRADDGWLRAQVAQLGYASSDAPSGGDAEEQSAEVASETIATEETVLEVPPDRGGYLPLQAGGHRVELRSEAPRDRAEAGPTDRRAALDEVSSPVPGGASEGRGGRFFAQQRGSSPAPDTTAVPADEAARFLAERERVDGLTFVEASGHWASTYVPGDPAVRLLRTRLASAPDALALAERASTSDFAIDPPSSGALALRVGADRAAVSGRSRVLVAVGVQGAEAGVGRRPTLQAQVVIDARAALDSDAQAKVRALLSELSRRRQGSDRIGVIVAGPHGGELLPLGSLRFGELTVALRRLFGESDAPPMSLEDAVRSAIASVGQLEDARSPLGSALVLVVSPGLSDADASALVPSVHAGALAGVTTSVLAIDDAASIGALDRVAIAGQGRRRALASIDEAEALVASEIEAVSRVVARSVRLRVRLAPGVSLVDVIGSRRLDGEETRRVREAEQAIDRRLARTLGIASDRDDEEDGIQMVMPAFYAGDRHVVLLDLVVPGPGPALDVSVRWKDLVRAGNGRATERLTLASGSREPTPRERQVLGQLLAHELSVAMREAAAMVERGQWAEARARLESAARLIRGTEGAIRDRAASERAALVGSYEAALREPGPITAHLADSLRYASHRMVHAEPRSLAER